MISGSSTQTDNSIYEKFCQGNDINLCNIYGGLYQWNEMMNYSTLESAIGLCPEGWHIPSNNEWCTLENEVDVGSISCSSTDYRGTDAGGNLKESGTIHWADPNVGATNTSSFTALPGGDRFLDGNFYYLSELAFFWTSTQGGGAWTRGLWHNSSQISRGDNNKDYGFSVRCIKD